MIRKLRALSAEYEMLPAGTLILCAVSGGADSMCLLHLLETLAPERGFSLHAAHFNHKLRGTESDRDEEFVRAWCAGRGIPLTVGSGDVQAETVRTGRGVEETARALRYAFLERTAEELGAARIATAHTADDNAETLLFHLVRGSGLQGLTGIPPRRGKVVRPLLTCTRTEVVEYCTAHNVAWVEDSTNADETFTRNFLRRRVMPLLEQINPRTAEHLSAAAERLRADNDYLNAQAARAAAQGRMTSGGLVIEAELLAQLPDPVALRAVRQLLEQAGGGKNCTAAHLDALLRLCRSDDPSGRADLPGLTARREYGTLVLEGAEEPVSPPPPTPVREDGRTVYGDTGWSVTCRQTVCPEKSFKNPDTFYLSRAKIKGALTLRPRQTGDSIRLPGRNGKTLKKLFIDEKIPLERRALLPVLADDAGVLAVGSFGPDVSRLAQPGEEAVEITLKKE
ncbi:MAG: tRNA lysidine(34) synthetase TilS [Oscillospiraceae bacterium]